MLKGLVQVFDMSILYERAQKDKQNSEETTMIAFSVKEISRFEDITISFKITGVERLSVRV